MIFLGKKEFRDKVHACWLGKSIGGTMGAPYEGTHEYLSLAGFSSAAPESLPNDDLDLQLIWLQALEFSGVKNITAQTLGEYWLAFITPFWSEYGIAKSNMRKGLPPSVAGDYANVWKHSNGAWIRTEIWATLAPAAPAVAAKYAAEDAKVDHGTGEGTIAAAFVAALESAAFVLQDVRELLHLALGYIPEDSRVAKTVLLAESCFDSGVALREARDKLIAENADIGDGWFQAPTNVGFVVLGLLYGEGDFKKSMLAAINCGDDTDCTGATIGAVMGILGGMRSLPKDWRAHVGDTIVTGSINMGVSWIPVTSCKQLSERIFRLAPAMLAENNANVCIHSGKTKFDAEGWKERSGTNFADMWKRMQPYTFCMPFAFFTAQVRYCEGPVLLPNGTACIMLKLYNNVKAYGNQPYDLQVRVLLPKGVTADRTAFCVHLPHWSSLTTEYETGEIPIRFSADETLPASVRVVLEISAEGHYTVGYVPVVFLNEIVMQENSDGA